MNNIAAAVVLAGYTGYAHNPPDHLISMPDFPSLFLWGATEWERTASARSSLEIYERFSEWVQWTGCGSASSICDKEGSHGLPCHRLLDQGPPERSEFFSDRNYSCVMDFCMVYRTLLKINWCLMNFLPSVIIDCRADGRIVDKDLAHQLGIDRDPLPHHVLGQITHQKSPVHVSLLAEHPETMKFLLNLLPCLPPILCSA